MPKLKSCSNTMTAQSILKYQNLQNPGLFFCIAQFENSKTKVMFKYYDCSIYFEICQRGPSTEREKEHQ